MTHPAFTTSYENREMFNWPTQPTSREVTIKLTNKQWVQLMALLQYGVASWGGAATPGAQRIYDIVSKEVFPE